MNNKEILDNAPEGALGIKIMDGFYRWVLKDNALSKIYDCESLDGLNQIYRSLADIARITELEKELLLGTKNSIATDLLNVMEKDNVENFSIQVFKVDSGLKRDFQVTCEYLDGVSASETITELKESNAELEKTLSHCKVFLEEMHYLEVNETIKNSSVLHSEVSKALKETK